jgi:hypothetical protein
MESYLKGRGYKDSVDHDSSSFRGLLEDQNPKSSANSDRVNAEQTESEISTIYDEKDCPKVEVVSEDGRPKAILVHLPDNRILELECHY